MLGLGKYQKERSHEIWWTLSLFCWYSQQIHGTAWSKKNPPLPQVGLKSWGISLIQYRDCRQKCWLWNKRKFYYWKSWVGLWQVVSNDIRFPPLCSKTSSIYIELSPSSLPFTFMNKRQFKPRVDVNHNYVEAQLLSSHSRKIILEWSIEKSRNIFQVT